MKEKISYAYVYRKDEEENKFCLEEIIEKISSVYREYEVKNKLYVEKMKEKISSV